MNINYFLGTFEKFNRDLSYSNKALSERINKAINKPNNQLKKIMNREFFPRFNFSIINSSVPSRHNIHVENATAPENEISHSEDHAKPIRDDLPKESKMSQRKKLIIEKIKELGFDPLNPQPRKRGYAGMKKNIKEELQSHRLFQAKSSFNKAWSSLSVEEKIVDKVLKKDGSITISKGVNK